MAKNNTILKWLENAYGMEESIIDTLSRHAKGAKDYPKVRDRIEKHIDETKEHSAAVQKRLIDLGGEVPGAKRELSELVGKVQGIFTGRGKDKIVKQAISEYATEHFEIAVYAAIIAAAETAGDNETVDICRGIMRDEEKMADWLWENMPTLVRNHIKRTEKVAVR